MLKFVDGQGLLTQFYNLALSRKLTCVSTFLLDSISEWTIVGPNKYNIDNAFKTTDIFAYAESEEYCELLGENSRLYEPQDDETRTKVLVAIKSNDAVDETITNTRFWINAVRKTTDK